VATKLKFYQIYFKEDQLSELYPFATPYLNNNLTDYFENSVIADLVPKTDADFISVCSWRLKQKRGHGIRLNKELTVEALNDDYDIAILTPRSPTHKPLYMASVWHGKAWLEAIKDLKRFIRIPQEVKHSIYENHFVARSDIYKDYVLTCLLPVMDYMSTRPVYFAPSGYAKKKSPQEVEEYRRKTGHIDWPIAPFVLERLFSIWIDSQKFKVINK
jgi:hypothetical protein